MNSNRIEILQDGYIKPSKYVLYWMQQSQRIHYNHALTHAIKVANKLNLPLLILFVLNPNYKEARRAHFKFMLEGLRETQKIADTFHLNMHILVGDSIPTLMPFIKDAQAFIMDKGYLQEPIRWRNELTSFIIKEYPHIYIATIDTDLIVPVSVASNKLEYGAYTLRPKIHRLMDQFNDFEKIPEILIRTKININSNSLENLDLLLDRYQLMDKDLKDTPFRGGYLEAVKRLHHFLETKANRYLESNDPSHEDTSYLSPYLHFGQISPLEILNQTERYVNQGKITKEVYEAFVEQLVVRRELAFNYVYYNPGYDDFYQITEPWAYETMKSHESDRRPYLYTVSDYIELKTHDMYFNAAMSEMLTTGYMQNYMRMYWAKKIIEWSSSFEEAFLNIKYLNNRFFLDGRDPSSYAGIAWCFGKHDRAWIERPIFGKLRYMNASGLQRKFDMSSYTNKWLKK